MKQTLIFRNQGADKKAIWTQQGQPFGLLICALISENQGLEKAWSVSNLRKISGPVHLYLFLVYHLDFFQVYGINLASFLEKSKFAGHEIFLRFETDFNYSRPWFSEIKVQIKWLIDYFEALSQSCKKEQKAMKHILHLRSSE